MKRLEVNEHPETKSGGGNSSLGKPLGFLFTSPDIHYPPSHLTVEAMTTTNHQNRVVDDRKASSDDAVPGIIETFEIVVD
jgi:hypothetical protein